MNIIQTIRKLVPPSVRPHLGGIRRRIFANQGRIDAQRRKLLASPDLSPQQREWISRVDGRIHYRDGMYAGSGEQYFLAGLSALECADKVLADVGVTQVNSVLDLPSGYGRELRFFRLQFPNASFTACDIQPGAVQFCADEFKATPAVSKPDLDEIAFDDTFDLIWCGSLLTHLNSDSTVKLLSLFARHLSAAGLAIVTFHGDHVYRRLRDDGETYELGPASIPAMIADYERTGQAYSDYPRGLGYFDFHPDKTGYGISLTSPEWLRARLADIGGIEEVYLEERGWANHQDILAFRRKEGQGP